MTTLTPNKDDQDQDERYNPAQQDFLRDLENKGTLPEGGAAEQHSRSDNGDSQSQANDGEKRAVGDTVAGKAAVEVASTAAGAIGSPLAGQAVKLLGKIKTKKGGITGAVIAVIVAITLLANGYFATATAAIAFFTNVTDDLNDQVAALDNRQEKLMTTRITTADRAKALNGCTKLTIKCKYRSLSLPDVERFERAGVKAIGDTKFGRTFPNSYEVRGKTFTPKEFAVALKNDPQTKLAFRSALNMRSLGFADKVYAKVMERFGISKVKPTLSGDADEEFKNLANGEKTAGLTGDTRFVVVGKDADGKDIYGIEGDSSGRTYTQTEVDAISRLGTTGALKAGATKSLSQFTKVVNITGAADMYCSLKNMIGYASVAAKVAKNAKLARYVAPIASSVYAIKAGDGTATDGEVVGRYFTEVDDRKIMVDDQATFATAINTSSPDQGLTENDFSTKTKPNPYYGKNAMDSPLYKLSAMNGSPSAATSEATSKYSLALSESKVANVLGITAGILSLGGAINPACSVIQNWFVRGASFAVGVAAIFFGVGVANIANNIALAVAVSAAFMFIAGFLAIITNESPVPDDITEAPEERAAITWTGISALTSETARMSGMIPASAEEIVAYSASSKQSNLAYDTIEGQNISPWDTSSPHSTVSKMALSLQHYRLKSYSLDSISGTVGSVLSGAATRPFTQKAFAAEDDITRFQQCDDSAYEKFGISADVQCNLRYIMPAEDLARDPLEVAEYMEKEGYVEVDTETGLPPGYTLPSAGETNVGDQILSGAINSVYTTRNFVNDYGKFLDYCVYRPLPYGETFEESGAFGSADDSWKSGIRCLDRDEKMQAFRVYTLDKRAAEITEKPVATAPTAPISPSIPSPGVGTTDTNTRSLAQQILDLDKAGKINIVDFSTNRVSDSASRSLASQQLEDIAAGKPVGITTRCGFAIDPITPDPRILQFLVDFGNQYNYKLNSLFGQCHSRTSNHYEGRAVDFGCPTDISLADRVGQKYGVARNSENCERHGHYHYQAGGR